MFPEGKMEEVWDKLMGINPRYFSLHGKLFPLSEIKEYDSRLAELRKQAEYLHVEVKIPPNAFHAYLCTRLPCCLEWTEEDKGVYAPFAQVLMKEPSRHIATTADFLRLYELTDAIEDYECDLYRNAEEQKMHATLFAQREELLQKCFFLTSGANIFIPLEDICIYPGEKLTLAEVLFLGSFRDCGEIEFTTTQYEECASLPISAHRMALLETLYDLVNGRFTSLEEEDKNLINK